MPFDPVGRARRWNARWRSIVPIFVAEFMAVVGFGALLPVLPLYVTEQGVDPATLGVILAAWPAANLIFQPFFGWLADRTSRRGLMLAGLVVLTAATLLPLAFHGPVELFILRFVSGLGVSMYDPAARGTIVEETEEDERGEAFGLYSSAQMGGFIFGPSSERSGPRSSGPSRSRSSRPASVASSPSPISWSPSTHDHEHAQRRQAGRCARRTSRAPTPRLAATRRRSPSAQPWPGVRIRRPGTPARALEPPADRRPDHELRALLRHRRLSGRLGVVFQGLGGSVEWIGLTYVLFALPVVCWRRAPVAWSTATVRPGRDRAGMLVIACGILYAMAWEPLLPGGIIVVEGAAEAFMGPALYAVLAIGTPAGRASTAQGIYGFAGTIAFILSSLAAGWLFSMNTTYPFSASASWSSSQLRPSG